MRRKVWILGLVVFLFVLCVLIALLPRTSMDDVSSGKIIFPDKEGLHSVPVSEDDLARICELFNRKLLYVDSPSCGFTEAVSIIFDEGEQVFCFAQDDCPIIFCQKSGKYFRLSAEEYAVLVEILKKYGLTFPNYWRY